MKPIQCTVTLHEKTLRKTSDIVFLTVLIFKNPEERYSQSSECFCKTTVFFFLCAICQFDDIWWYNKK